MTSVELINSMQSDTGNNKLQVSADVAEEIPVVANVITDKMMGIKLDMDDVKSVNLQKVIKLLNSPHTAHFIDRHVIALEKLIKHNSRGFFMDNLFHLNRIITICGDRVESSNQLEAIRTHYDYIDSLIRIVHICGLPFLKRQSSDQLTYRTFAVDLLSQIGYLFRVDHHGLRLQICKTIHQVYSQPVYPHNFREIQPNDLEYNQSLVEASDIPSILIKSLELSSFEPQLNLAILNVLQSLSKNSVICCNKMLKENAANLICEQLSSSSLANNDSEKVFRSVEIIWNLLELGDRPTVIVQLSTKRAISEIRDVFLVQLAKTYSHYDRQLRNDLLVLATLIAEINQCAPFVETGFVKQLTLIGTFQEIKSHHPLVKNLKLALNHEDFEMKKLIISILVLLSRDSSVIPFLSDGQLLLSLFSYLPLEGVNGSDDKSATGSTAGAGGASVASSSTSNSRGAPATTSADLRVRSVHTKQWKPAYEEELQLHALSSLIVLAPRMLSDYIMLSGTNRLLIFLEWCIKPDNFKGFGNSFHGAGGLGSKKAQMRYCLRLILTLVSIRSSESQKSITGNSARYSSRDDVDEEKLNYMMSPSSKENKKMQANATSNETATELRVVNDNDVLLISQEFTDEGGIDLIISILQRVVQSNNPNDSYDVEMQCDMLLILAALCELDMHRKELFGQAGVDVAVHFLRKSHMYYSKCQQDEQLKQQQKKPSNGASSSFTTEILSRHKIAMATVECVWCCIIGCYTTEDYFLEKEGAFLLLDLLDLCPPKRQGQLLGCLVDLSENAKSLSHFSTWKGGMVKAVDFTAVQELSGGGDGGGSMPSASRLEAVVAGPSAMNKQLMGDQKHIAHLLCQIWRQEEARMRVSRSQGCALDDLDNPLAGLEDREEAAAERMAIAASSLNDAVNLGDDSINERDLLDGLNGNRRQKTPSMALPANQPSRSILEVSESFRANIYALFSRLGYVDYPHMPVNDHITLTIIERYLEFKMGEIWKEIEHELEAEQIRPVSPDVEALQWIKRCIEQEAVQVSRTQQELIEAQHDQEKAEEYEYYSQLRENHRLKEKTLKDFENLVERTSNYDQLKLAKQEQIKNIEASRMRAAATNQEKHTISHCVDIPHLNITQFCAQTIAVDSTPVQVLGGTLEARRKFLKNSSVGFVDSVEDASGGDKLPVVELIG